MEVTSQDPFVVFVIIFITEFLICLLSIFKKFQNTFPSLDFAEKTYAETRFQLKVENVPTEPAARVSR
jgi:hypothetical protein